MNIIPNRPGQPKNTKRYVTEDGMEYIWFGGFYDALNDEREIVSMTPFQDGHRIFGTNINYIVGNDADGRVRAAVNAHNALIVG